MTVKQKFTIALQIVLLLVIIVLHINFDRPKSSEVPEVVVQMFSEFLAPTDHADAPLVDFSKYIRGASADPGTLSDGLSLENFVFQDVCYKLVTSFDEFKLEGVSPGFCKIYLYENGELLPPPIGFWYTIGDDNLIIDWKLGRLLPFSRHDSEYSESWGDLYG